MIKKYVVVLHRVPFYALPLRQTVKNHLDCFGTYGNYPVIYINVAYGIPFFLLKKIPIQAIIFHTSFLVMRWTPKLFAHKTKKVDFFKNLTCPKIALPQDEFIHTQILVDFFNAVNITHVYSCASKGEWKNIYKGLNKGVKFNTVLTGYIRVEDIKIAQDYMDSTPREIDVGYRTQHMPSWLGRHGELKIKIAEKTQEIAPYLGLKIDISTDPQDILSSKKWMAFLSRCRAIIGVEGGASILDRDGSLREKIEAIEKTMQDPEKSILCQEILKEYEGNLNLKAISPRHFEACLTRTYQILVEGEYNGVLKAGEHYFPVKKDFSNLAEALESLKDVAHVQRVTEKAYQDIVCSGQYIYKNFVEFIEKTAFEMPSPEEEETFPFSRLALSVLKIRNALLMYGNMMLGFLFGSFSHKKKEKALHFFKWVFYKVT